MVDTGFSRRAMIRLSATAGAIGAVGLGRAETSPDRRAPVPDRRDQPFDSGWRFFRGDIPDCAALNFDDAAWRALDLPHDWTIEDLPGTDPALNAVIRAADTAPLWQRVTGTPQRIGPFDARTNDNVNTRVSANGLATASTVGGVGWYRKRFILPELPADAHVELTFEAVYMNAQVWLNGVMLGEHPYGYTPFTLDLTPHLQRAGVNQLAVRVANLGRNSRWYSGSGIFRPVRLSIVRSARFEPDGLTVTTPSVSRTRAVVAVEARLANAATGMTLTTRVIDAAGRQVAAVSTPADRPRAELQVERPRLWSPDAPHLYRVECVLSSADGVVDRMVAPLGIRKVEVDAARGLHINGTPVKLRGGCVHHDNGLLGAVAIERAEERKVELLKARGFNAVRSAHNPSSRAFLAACDRLGMLVIEESFDSWRVPKNPDDYSLFFDGWWRRDLAAMVRRAANHPCVIVWSIGNEIPERGEADGIATAKMLADEVRRLDPTRPVTAALPSPPGKDVLRPDGTHDQEASQHLDIAGYNYQTGRYAPDHAAYPQRVFVGTESWPSEADAIWRLTEAMPSLIGDFVWTAMDYLGEAGIGRTGLGKDAFNVPSYPWFGASCGDIDLIGQQRPQSLFRDVVWGISSLEVAVQRPLPEGQAERPYAWGWRDELESWTWPGAEGRALSVSVYARADRVTIELNGKQVADRPMDPAVSSRAEIAVAYAPGMLAVTAWRGGRRIGRRTLETAGPPAGLRLVLDRPRIAADRGDLAYATVEVVDAAGRRVPDAVQVIRASLVGAVELAAFGNANPRGVASFRQPVAKTFHGRALAIVRPTGAAGPAMIAVAADRLTGATARLTLEADK